MTKRPVDKTKKSNIKCEHCKCWQARSTTNWFKRLFHCSNPKSPKSEQVTNYWNRCKCFEWKEGE